MDIAIQAEGLSKAYYPRRGPEILALDRLDLAVPRGETYALIGPDGAGKTTTIRLLTGLLRPTEGRVAVLGHDPTLDSYALNRRMGYMAQQANVYPDLTVIENLRFFASVRGLGPRARAARLPGLLDFAGLSGFTTRLGQHLSGGMKKKLALACMLVHDPEVLFLDEPTLGVDPVSRREFWDLLAVLRSERQVTIFVCTPYMDEVARCHRAGLIYNGRLVAQGEPREIGRQVPGQLLECRPSDFDGAKALLPGLPGILEIQSLGDRLRVFVDDASLRGPQIVAALTAHGIDVDGWRDVRPGIEEAFISLIREQDEGRAL